MLAYTRKFPQSLHIFFISGLVTLIVTAGVLYSWGLAAFLTTLGLIAIEVIFSIDNAIINARILATMSLRWQQAFMTLGIAFAVIGMRIVFPLMIVVLTAHLPWRQVIDLALHHSAQYAERLQDSHLVISAFGGCFLMILCLHFLFDDSREIVWWYHLEQRLQSFAWRGAYIVISIVVLMGVAVLTPTNERMSVLFAGAAGIITYLAIHSLTALLGNTQQMSVRSGLAGLGSFVYLETLDASFSFDGVIGAFALTTDIVLIGLGLGLGALWVRSLTVYMVRQGTLTQYRYLEHGAHYTIGVLSLLLLAGIFFDIPQAIGGIIGMGIITAAIISSLKVRK